MSDESIDQRERFHELLSSFREVMLVTHNNGSSETDGPSLHDSEFSSRPMSISRLDDNCDLWFLTDVDSAKVFEIREDPQVHVIAQDAESRFVSLSGTARVSQDRALIKELFSEPQKVWWPDGPESPGIRVLHITASEGAYWDTKGVNGVKYLLRAVKAYATGSRPSIEPGEITGKVDL